MTPIGRLALAAALTLTAAAPALAANIRPMQAFRDAPYAPEMVALPAGSYLMGSTEAETTREQRAAGPAAYEHPQHRETVPAFAIGKYLVTVAEFDRFEKDTRRPLATPCTVDEHGVWKPEAGRSYLDPAFQQTPRNPAVCVTWDDAKAYTEWLSQKTGKPYRLVRDVEFEYAERAGTTTARWWGDSPANLCAHANAADISFDKANPGDKQANLTCDDGFGGTNPVGHFPANPWGLYDMAGNAWEWTADCFRDSYTAIAPPEAGCERRTIRGGSWHNYPNVIRSATRFWLPPTMRASSTGFRVARDLDD